MGATHEGFSAIDVNVCFGEVKTPMMRPIGLTGADASGAGMEVEAIEIPPPQNDQDKVLLSSYTLYAGNRSKFQRQMDSARGRVIWEFPAPRPATLSCIPRPAGAEPNLHRPFRQTVRSA